MKKLIGAAVVAAVVAGGWLGAMTYIGHRVEAGFDAAHAETEKTIPFVHFRDRSVERGLGSTVYRGKVLIGCDASKRDKKGESATGPAANGNTTGTPTEAAAKAAGPVVEIGFEHRVRHGPWLDGGLAAATIDSRVTLPDIAPEPLRDYVTRLPADAVQTRIGLTGGYQSTVRLPAADLRMGPLHMTWADTRVAVNGRMGGGPGSSTWDLPSMSVFVGEGAEASGLTLKGMRATKDALVSPKSIWLTSGQEKVSIDRFELTLAPPKSQARISARDEDEDGDDDEDDYEYDDEDDEAMARRRLHGKLALDKIVTDQTSKVDGDLISFRSAMTVDALTWTSLEDEGAADDAFKLTRIDYRDAIERVHAPTLENWLKLWLDGFSAICRGEDPGDPGKLVDALRPLLAHRPSISLDKLAFDYEGHRGEFNYGIAMRDVKEADLQGEVLSMLEKVDVKAGLDVPSKWVEWIKEQILYSEPSMLMVAVLLDEFVNNGWATIEGERLKTNFTIEKGKLTANGKPISLPGSSAPDKDDPEPGKNEAPSGSR